MKFSYERDMLKFYEQAGRGHDQLREQLMARLDEAVIERGVERARSREVRLSSRWDLRMPVALRTALAAAAVFAFLFSVLFLAVPSGENNSQAAWAAAVENAFRVKSVHLELMTPSKGGMSSVELWWRRPNCCRIEFSDELVLASNGEKHYQLDRKTNTVTISEAQGPGVEAFLLGTLGQLFTCDDNFARKWIKDSKNITSEEKVYKGEKCRKIVSEKDGRRYEYIIDVKAPMIYEAKIYDEGKPARLRQHMEVLEVDRQIPDRMFEIDTTGKRVINGGRSFGGTMPSAVPAR